MAAKRDWRAWHEEYDNPRSSLAARLTVVRARVAEALSAAPAGPLRLVSMCAGEGRDLIPVLAGHERGRDVAARLVELDPVLADAARRAAAAAGLALVDVVTGDAGCNDVYRGMVPADIVMVCGVFGNITEADITRTIRTCTQLCAAGATVVWTRGRRDPDVVPRICDWFAAQHFELMWLSQPDAQFGVGVHRFAGQPRPLRTGSRMFAFTR
ncbi:MAG: SAM-dependent methyltransferase [Actinobacteria bacterium]|nr:SAM-dependent methyltransferase [Actinomycetota bacterium]